MPIVLPHIGNSCLKLGEYVGPRNNFVMNTWFRFKFEPGHAVRFMLEASQLSDGTAIPGAKLETWRLGLLG